MGTIIDLTGQQFGRLTVVSVGDYYVTPNGRKVKRWLCKCECGEYVNVNTTHLRTGETQSCGCYRKDYVSQNRKTHGMFGTRIYTVYSHMLQRCYNNKIFDYSNYGGRGIKVCDEWLNDFQAFYNWSMANGYTDKLSIDRIDVNGNYEPSNCRWTTSKKQNNNRRNNRLLTYRGETHTMAEWADIVGIDYRVLACRICTHKWSVERALTQEVRK